MAPVQDAPKLPAKTSGGAKLVSGLDGVPGDMIVQGALARIVLQELSPIFIAYLEGNVLFANNAYMRLFGLTPSATHEIDEHLGELREEVNDILAALKEPAGRLTTQRSFPVGAGNAHYRVQYFPVFDVGDRLVGIGGVYYDVSAQVTAIDRLRVTQESFNDVLRSSSDWVWETDDQGRISFISERITEITGRPPALLTGQALPALAATWDGEAGGASVETMLVARVPFRNKAFELKDRDGQVRRHYLSAVPFFHLKTGRFAGFRGTGTDVSQQFAAEEASKESRKQLETALEELNRKNMHLDMALERAQVAIRAKGEFLANMSHELRTPLNAIIGFADVIARQRFGADIKRYAEYAGYILKAGNHLLNIINDVLDVSRVESNTLKIDLEVVSLKDIIGESISLIEARAAQKGIALDAGNRGEGCTVMVDRTRALQILVNLLTNAVKFTPDNGKIGIEINRKGESRVDVTVWDTGAGIAPDKLEAIFTPFYQVHEDAYSRPHEGVGLGLSIARHLSRMMNGDIVVESVIDYGSRFTVTFPLAASAAAASSA